MLLSGQGQGVYFYLNHPIRWVQVTGTIVDFECIEFYLRFKIDDSSGTLIEVILPRRPPQDHPKTAPTEQATLAGPCMLGISASGNEIDLGCVEIGMVVKVKGGIREFRNIKEISLERIFYIQDTTAEIKAWDASSRQYHEVLSRPWELPAEEVRRLKRRELRREENRKERREACIQQTVSKAAVSSKEILKHKQ